MPFLNNLVSNPTNNRYLKTLNKEKIELEQKLT